MGTTARIYLVTDRERDTETRAARINFAQHLRPEVTLFQYMDGYPRCPHGNGVLDRLEAAFATAPKRVLEVASELAVHLIVEAAKRTKDPATTGYNLVPSHPTVGAITYNDYLVICHAGVEEPPTVLVQLGCLWRTEGDFKRAQADDQAGYELLLASRGQSQKSEGSWEGS